MALSHDDSTINIVLVVVTLLLLFIRQRDSVDSTVEENFSVFILVAVSKSMRAVKLCTNKILQFLTGGGSVAEWLACWIQVQKGPDSNRSRDAVG